MIQNGTSHTAKFVYSCVIHPNDLEITNHVVNAMINYPQVGLIFRRYAPFG